MTEREGLENERVSHRDEAIPGTNVDLWNKVSERERGLKGCMVSAAQAYHGDYTTTTWGSGQNLAVSHTGLPVMWLAGLELSGHPGSLFGLPR